MADPAAIDDVIDRALDAHATLTALGEGIEDEWTYVADLSRVWRARLEQVREARGGETAQPAAVAAVDAAIDEVGRIEDPHRAIDWLSTYPQVVLLALGERP